MQPCCKPSLLGCVCRSAVWCCWLRISARSPRDTRFVQWRRDWAHAVQAMQAPEELATSLPSALLDDRHVSVQLIDPVHWRGRASINVRDAHLLRERIDAVLQRSKLAFPVNTLGL